MKIKQILIAGTLLVSVASFSQKDELKALKKVYTKDAPSASDIVDYKSNLTKLESLATEEADKVYLNFYKSILPKVEFKALGANPQAAQIQKTFGSNKISDIVSGYINTLDYEKKSGKKVLTDNINEDLVVLKPVLLNTAISLGEGKKYNEAADILYGIYLLDKKDQEKLYYAASYAVNARDYDKALMYYNELKQLNYSGEAIIFYATNKSTKEEESFGTTKVQRDLMIQTGQFINPREEKLQSRKGEIFKNIALILVQQGKDAEAKAAISDARKANPDDTSLMITEAEFSLKDKDYANYSRIVNEALLKDPNNVQLVFNLGVISGESGKLEDAEKYYRRAMEIDPKYFDAYLNLAELKLRADKTFVEQMNKLGTSDSDNKKFDEIREKQKANYRDVLPLLEKAMELKADNEAAKTTLLGVYQALEMTAKYKELKAKQ
jgi:Tetratricopeptide repeat